MYTGPSPRNLGLSVLLHGAAIAGMMNLSLPTPPPDALSDAVRPTEIRLGGKLYYVAQIDGSNSAPAPKAASNSSGIAAPRARTAGRAPSPAARSTPAATPTPAPAADAAPAPIPEKIRAMRQQARAFIPPEVRPNPLAKQTLIQPLSPPDLVPPPTPLPNFRVLADVKQLRKIPKPFEAPGRRTPPTPAQAPNIAAPALELVPLAPAPVGDPLSVLSLNDRPVPFNEKVVVPAGNVAPPPLESTGPPGTSGSTPGNSPAGNGTTRAAGATGATDASGNPASAGSGAKTATSSNPGNGSGAGNAPSNSAGPGTGRSAVGSGTGSALAGGSTEGSPVAIVGGNGGGASPASNGAGAGNASANGAGAGTGDSAGAGTGAGRTTPGSPVINRPATGNFDAVVVQSSPVDQYPESRGLLSGRPIYSVYVTVGTARDWTMFFCVPGEKPESGGGPIVHLSAMSAPVLAPYPIKLIKPKVTLPTYEKYVLVHGVVNKEGKFESLRVVRPIKPETDQALLAALASWEFRAATRDGAAIVVEFLLSIPAKGL